MDLARLFQKGKERLAINGGKLSKGFGVNSGASDHAGRVREKRREVKNRLRPRLIRGRINP
jgi:hypothetical protein